MTLLTFYNTAQASALSCFLLLYSYSYLDNRACWGQFYFIYKLKDGIVAGQTGFPARRCSCDNRGSGTTIPMEDYNSLGPCGRRVGVTFLTAYLTINKNVSQNSWSLRYAPGVLSAMAAATGAYINNHYRSRLRLGGHGRLSTYLPIVAVPAMFTMLGHKFFIQRPILLKPLTECPVCTQVRSAFIQAAAGVVYPTILAPLAAFMFATRCFTYRLPSVTENPREVFMLYRKFTRPIVPALGTIIAIQAFVTMYLTGKEEKQSFEIMLRMKEIEHELEEKHLPQRIDF